MSDKDIERPEGTAERSRPRPEDLTWREAEADDQTPDGWFVLETTYRTMHATVVGSGWMTEERFALWLRGRCAGLTWQIVSWQGEDVGALSLGGGNDSLHVNSIHVLPERQGQGIGTAMMRAVFAEAERDGVPVTLEVLEHNRATVRFYERLGFVTVGRTATPPQYRMRYVPPGVVMPSEETPAPSPPPAAPGGRLRAWLRTVFGTKC